MIYLLKEPPKNRHQGRKPDQSHRTRRRHSSMPRLRVQGGVLAEGGNVAGVNRAVLAAMGRSFGPASGFLLAPRPQKEGP